MNSRLYRGKVWHTRGEPAYQFQYRVWYLGLDLAETGAVASKLRLLSHNRHNLLSIWDRDYLALEERLAGSPDESGGIEEPMIDSSAGRSIELITVPRILGHAFNPVSFFLERKAGSITGVRAEVHNTWGERHVYGLENRATGDGYESEVEKSFYVSPFLPMEGGYRFELVEDDDGRLRIKIELEGGDGQSLFSGGIDVRPLALSDANLARLLVSYPFVNLKTVAMIHWQGLKLWLRGVKFGANPSRGNAKRRQLWPRGH